MNQGLNIDLENRTPKQEKVVNKQYKQKLFKEFGQQFQAIGSLSCALTEIHYLDKNLIEGIQQHMRWATAFANLFHRKQRHSSDYNILSSFKKYIFLGSLGFITCLSLSKFYSTSIEYAFEPTRENQLLVKLNPTFQRGKYYPSMPLIFGVMQWLYAQYREEEPFMPLKPEELDAGTLQWMHLHDKARSFKHKKKEIPIVIVVAGSAGIDNTVKHLMLSAYNMGYRTVAVDPKDLYDQQKLDTMVKHVRQKYPNGKYFAMGVEYGANLLVNYTASHNTAFDAIISVGNPFDLGASQLQLQNSWVWKPLLNYILQARISKAQLQREGDFGKSLFELDKNIYKISDEDYLAWKSEHSSINVIKNLETRALFLQSKEDPFTQAVKDERFQNEKCLYVTTKRGGHNEWFQNLWMDRWFKTPIQSFLRLQNQQSLTVPA